MKRYQQKSARRYRQEDQEIGVLRGGGTLQKKEQNDFSILGSLHHEKIVWEVCPSRKSTSIKNIYYTQDKERREVILDAQGVLRSLDEEGNLVFRDWEKKMELLPCCSIVGVQRKSCSPITRKSWCALKEKSLPLPILMQTMRGGPVEVILPLLPILLGEWITQLQSPQRMRQLFAA